MKLKYLASLLLSFCSFSYAAENSVISVDKIKIGKILGTESGQEFSMLINLSNNSDREIGNWQIGFYMPRTFDTMLSQNINPELQMQICNIDNSCTNLRYLKNSDITDNDLSQGALTILEPITKFALSPKQNYYVKILNNNQGVIGNYSAFPQSFFLIEVDSQDSSRNKFYQLATEMDKYELTNVNQEQIEQQIKARIQHNWEHSLANSESNLDLIPMPQQVKYYSEPKLVIPTAKQRVFIDNQVKNIESSVLQQWAVNLQQSWKLKYPVSFNLKDADKYEDKLVITIDDVAQPQQISNNPEGYILNINSQKITINILTSAGVVYAMQTLRQLSYGKTELPALEIIDYPSLAYRGLLLDVARHYFSVDDIKRLIDVLATVKMNVLHLHLSDDEAFRIALDSYPQLQQVASIRGIGQNIGANWLLQNNLDTTNLTQKQYPVANTPYGGYYTATDIQQIINYANLNQITVIPEIDLPGHARALIKALPNEMIDHNDSTQTMSVQGYRNNVLPICTYATDVSVGVGFTQAINTIITQVSHIFDNQSTIYAVNKEISLGGDEVPANSWSDDSSCKGEWNDINTITALDKTHLFFNKVAQENPDLKVSGWQQLVQEDSGGKIGKNALKADSVAHIWVWSPSNSGVKEAISLIEHGYSTVLAFADKAYFDIAYNPSLVEPGFTWSTNMMDTYNILSMANSITQVRNKVNQKGLVRGVEGTLWSENLPSNDHLMYMALPRIPALSEVGWSIQLSKSQSDIAWQNFAQRLGCGQQGYLAYVNNSFAVNYRGYPNGIIKEVPIGSLCEEKVTDTNLVTD